MSDDLNRPGPTINPYRAPLSEEPSSANSDVVQLAKRWRRLVARILDGVILSPVLILVFFIVFRDDWLNSFLAEIVAPQDSMGALDVVWTGTVFSFQVLALQIIVYTLVNGYLLAKRGQSVGKWLMKIRIVDYYSSEITPLRFSLVLREGIAYLLGIFGLLGTLVSLVDVLFIFGGKQRCLHDYWAMTKVVNVGFLDEEKNETLAALRDSPR